MKKIFSIFILAIATILSASASQIVKVVYNGTSRSITFRTNKVSATRVYYARSTTTSPTFSMSVTPTTSGNYSTFSISSGSTNNNNNKTIQIQLDDAVTFFEITTNPTYASTIDFSKALNLTSICLKGCTGLTAMTLGTMSALTDIDVSNTSAAVANAITAAKCPVLENLNVANCSLTSLAYTGTTLFSLDVTGNNISTLSLSGNSNLDIVRCESNNMTSLTVSNTITTISAQSNNLTTLTGYGDPIKILDVASNGLTTLNLEGIEGLTDLDISSNHLTFRSFPSAEKKPARVLYSGNDGQYDFSSQLKPAFGSYSYPLQSKLPNYASRNETAYTLDLTDARLDGHGVQCVVPTANSYNGTTLTPLTLSTSDVDGNDYAKSNDENLYGFMKALSRVRFSFTNANYPGLTLYSNDFTVPEGVTGTLQIVDEDGVVLYTIANAMFSDATDGIPEEAKREYTKYTCPPVPTTSGQTWTVTAGPSDDAPFGWAKTYGSATWYYLGLKNKWVTGGEQLYSLGGGQGYNGHKLKDSYDTTDDNYQWAFVGNQYSGFKIYNKGRGSGETLQDYAGFHTVSNQYGYFPVLKSGESLTWRVRTNSSGTGFSLENVEGGTDFTHNSEGESAPAFLNDFQGKGGLNYWITNDYDAQNDVGSRFTVVKASDPISATIKWIVVDDNNNHIYTVVTDVESGQTISSYPTELTTLASKRFVTLPALTSFVASGGQTEKLIPYTWTGPFQISTTGNEHYYKLKIRNALYITSNTMSGGQLDCTATDATTNDYRWMFYGDPFNGFFIRNYAKGTQALTAANGTHTDGTSFPTFTEEGSRWIITTCTQSGYTNPFSIAPAGSTGVYWNQYGGINNSQGLKYWTYDGTSDGGAAIQAIEITEEITAATITWNVVDGSGNILLTVTSDHNINSTVSSYPSVLTAYEDRFVSFPALSSFTADRSKSVQVTYSWTGPFQLTTDVDNPNLYFFKSTRYGYYAYAPAASNGTAKQSVQTKNWVTQRGRWFFTGDPFNGIEIRPYAHPETGLVNSALSTTPTKYIPKAVPSITTNYWDNPLPSAAISFILPSNTSQCLAEQLGTWSSESISSDKGLSFVVEDGSDVSMALPAIGYYHVRCMGTNLTTKYWKLDSDHMLYNNGDTNKLNSVFRIQENVNSSNNLPDSYYISSYDGGDAWYLDNTRTTYSQQFTATQTAASYMPAQIIYNAKSGDTPFYAIKLGTFESYDGYSYANTNNNGTTVVTWNYSSGNADGSAWTFEPFKPAMRSVDNATYFTTAYLPFDYTLPEDVKAYTITVTGEGAAQTHELEGGVPAGTGVLIVGDGVSEATVSYKGFGSTSDDETNLSTNVLTGTYTDHVVGADEAYVFSAKNNTPGFYKYKSGSTLAAYKAYIPYNAAKGLNAREYIIVFNGGEATAIEVISENTPANGSESVFDLQGRRVAQPQKGGIYIINGRKVYVK